MKMDKAFLCMLFVLLLFPSSIYAHPGRTAADGCHYCRTNCDSWGVPWNERHCHNGGSAPAPVIQQEQPVYIPPTEYVPPPTRIPTKRPTPTKTPTPVPTVIPTLTLISKPITTKQTKKVQKTTNKPTKKSFWQWLFGS